jgi:hypothetical protein
MTRPFSLIFALLLLLPSARAVEITRVLKTFDFEERRLGNQEDLPMNWSKVSGPGLPHYVHGKLANDQSHGGQWSFRFDLNGGGLIYRYQAGLLKVQAGTHYRIEGYCLTTPLRNARARITAWFADSYGRLIEGSARHSELYAASMPGDAWKKLTLSLTADVPQADSLVIDLELLQPSQYTPASERAAKVLEQDYRGNVWWDDITISQVPVVAMRTDKPANVFRLNEPVRIAAVVSDRSTDDLTAKFIVLDAEGRQVYRRTSRPEVQTVRTSAGRQARMLVEVPTLPPGWYRAWLIMTSGGLRLQSASLAFVVLADSAKSAPGDGRFGVVATQLPFDSLAQLPAILPMLSAGRVKLAVWSDQGGVDSSNDAQFDRVLTGLGIAQITPSACLLSPPMKLADKLKGTGWPGVLKLKNEEWQSELAFLVSRYANHIEQWQLGPDDDTDFVSNPAARTVYDRVYKEFSQLIADPELAMPWPAWYELAPNAPSTIAFCVPTSVLPSQMPLYLKDLKRKSDRSISVSLQPLDRAKYGLQTQVRDLSQRIIYALAAGSTRIDVPAPLSATSSEAGVRIDPDPLFMVERTIFSTLSGAKYKGRIEFGSGIQSFLFDRGGEGILVMWTKGDSEGLKSLPINIGLRPVCIDLWGNATPLLRPSSDPSAKLPVGVGTMPIFLVDIDGPQAQFRAGVTIDNALLESSFRPHARHIRFSNTYNKPISGTLFFRAPAGWILTPASCAFTLNPGEASDQLVEFEFPYNAVAGLNSLQCEFTLEGEKNANFVVPLTLRLGLSDVGMRTIAFRDGREIYVEQTITNYGERPISYAAWAMYPDEPRQERLVMSLEPGSTTVRRYRFSNVSQDKIGLVRVGIKELEGSRILNDAIEVK